MTIEEKATALGLALITIRELGSRPGYVALSAWDIPDPFVSIHSVMRRAGKYRIVAGAIIPFTVSPDYQVWALSCS